MELSPNYQHAELLRELLNQQRGAPPLVGPGFRVGEDELSNVYNWGKHFRDYKDRWRSKFPKYFNDKGVWNKICIRCNKNLQGIPRYDIKTGKGVKWLHCKECGNKYEKEENKYRNKGYRLLKIVSEDKICEFTGCNKRQLIYYFELLFDDNMNWENQNKYWQIDHRIPVKWFDLFDEEELLFCCNFKNLQPMAAQLNNDKSCSFPDNLLFS